MHVTVSARRGILAFIATILTAQAAGAATGDMRLTAVSEDNRPIAGVKLTIESRDGRAASVTTDVSGESDVTGLTTGFYRVTAVHEDFIQVVEPSIRIVRGKAIPVSFVLRRKDGEKAIEEVVVVADAIRVDAFGSVSNAYLDREHLRTATGSGADVLRALDGLPGLISTGEFMGSPLERRSR